jgi:hypothetical protein
MNYREKERTKVIRFRDRFFRDPGSGLFEGKHRDFVLSEPALNLWDGIREDCKEYFQRNRISWWKGENNGPTGHLLSSQVSCLNHLYASRQRADIAAAILKSIDPFIEGACIVETGFVEFEYIGQAQYLREKSFTRGANCTSIDALMIGRTSRSTRILVFIEWKYTESYPRKDLYTAERARIYDNLITAPDSPFCRVDVRTLYFEPFYQLMRQTLLAHKCIKHGEYGCSDYIHVHVVSDNNKELLNCVTSPHLTGSTMSEAWKSTLKMPDRYITISPRRLLANCKQLPDTLSWIDYLKRRYWT